jgi:dinuclear metal center YbgI/SA1388 family protein
VAAAPVAAADSAVAGRSGGGSVRPGPSSEAPSHLAALHDIIEYLDALLSSDRFDDYGPNGLQVPGRPEVDAVGSGVSAHLELFERAAAAGVGLVLVHHGLFWDRAPRSLSPTLAARLRVLLERGMSLAAYHLPLDAHPEVGNNALIAAGLGCAEREPFGRHRGMTIGVRASFADDGLPAADVFARVEALTGRPPLVFESGPDRVRSIGIVSGGGAGSLGEAAQAGLDAFLTGEPSEPAMEEAREAGIHFIAAGHYATETFGIRRLGDLVAERFGLEHRFIDVPNPV